MTITYFLLIFLLIFPITMIEINALRQVAGPITVDIIPGQTKSFTWTIVSDNDYTTSIGVTAEGWGSQFLSFPKTIDLDPLGSAEIQVEVFIPNDHPGDSELNPRLIATDFGEKGGAVVVNIQVMKIPKIIIAQNENSEFWGNTAYDEPQTEVETTTQTQKEPEQPKGTLEIIPQNQEQTQEEGGGCLIATAAYGSEMTQQVQLLREIRDDKLLATSSGTSFMSGFNSLYYTFSPTIADLERQNPIFKEVVKVTITPLLTSLSILNYVDMDSEEQVLGYGISLILLNIGMYFVAPAILIRKVLQISK